jgi:four helix bundle protein
MNNKDFSKQFEKRTREFAVQVIKLSISLPNTEEGRVIKNQISKSGTSVGANYRESNRARSKKDFANKIRISESEASETIYWLEIINDLKWGNKIEFDLVYKEASEILAILTTISRSLKD